MTLPLLLSAVAGASDLVSGWWTLRRAPGERDTRYVLAIAAGLVIAAAFFELLPSVKLERHAPVLLLGFVTFYLLEKVVMLHSCGEAECHSHRIGAAAVVGMALDNFVDGAGIAVGFQQGRLAVGLTVTLAVVVHEIPQGIASAVIMRAAGWSNRRATLTLLAAGLLYPLGALLGGNLSTDLQAAVLAFVAGSFLYVGSGDLLPEAHKRFNWKVIAMVVLGMALMYGLHVGLPHHPAVEPPAPG